MRTLDSRRASKKPASKNIGRWPLLAVLLASSLLACSPLGTLNELSEGDHYTVENGLPYGAEPRQVLDVYEPRERTDNAPVVVFIYGGGWREGKKADYAFVGTSLTAAGFTVVIPDYRLFPEVRFPVFVEDGADAVAWVERELIADTERPLFLMGHSAGAHIAGLLALDPAYLQSAGVDPGRLAGWIGLSGPYDFLPIESGYLLDVFPGNSRAQSQPIRFVSGDAPPTLLVHGADDGVVEPGNSRRLANALEAAGVDVTLVEQEGRSHAATVAALAPPLEFVGDTRGVVVGFIEDMTGDTRHRQAR
ncbi:MAG: alpha/beta hydrolase [Xanthomonadales bacterium]|jgi:acetyl esterase/lipase|nr:alpha/beta hydrolase [Xanthomonadales bacterium]